MATVTKKYFLGILILLIGFSQLSVKGQSITITQDGISCNVGNGRLIAHVTSGGSPYSYFLYNADPFLPSIPIQSVIGTLVDSVVFSNIPAGTYWIRFQSTPEGSIIPAPVNLVTVQTQTLTANIIVTEALSCPTSNDATLSADVAGGNPPYTYLWGPGGELTPNITVGQGIYNVTVDDSYGCYNIQSEASYFFFDGDDSIPTAIVPGTIASSQNICFNTSPAAFTNQTSASGGWGFTYQWQDSITSGTWQNIAGATAATYDDPANLISAKYYRRAAISTRGCGTVFSNIVTVLITALPVPTLSGPNPACLNVAGNVYTTEAGMSNYIWTVSAGGTITAGGGVGNNTVTVTWTTTGAKTITVNYTNANGCTGASATAYNITVNALPVPTIVGPTPVCVGSTGNVYTTEAGMSNYIWTVSAGGTITAGGGVGNNTVTVTWTTTGAKTVTVNYTNGNGCTAASATSYNVTVAGLPSLDAGPRDSTCYSSINYLINGASASNYSTLQWTIISGSGSFLGGVANTINPTYVFSVGDKNNGNGSLIKLQLQANGIGACASNNRKDTLEILLAPEIKVSIGSPAPFLIGANTQIEVCLSTSGHQRNLDMGYYLMAPDGVTKMTLKKGPQEFNYFSPCTPVSGGVPGDVNNLCFTTELTLTDTLNICTQARPMTGTFAASGNWNTLFGLNPAEGGWAIMVKDTANNRPTINDGNIINASLSFTDTATATGTIKTIDYESGVISIPIIELANTSYLIPQGLQVSCAGECDAIAMVNTIGGIPPYTNFIWSPLPFGGNATDSVVLCAGTYNLTVDDALGCQGTTSVIVTSPPIITIDELTFPDSLGCSGDTTGIILAIATGGTGSLTYTLMPGNIPSVLVDSGLFVNIPAGNYTLHIEDVNGCYYDTSFTISQPPILVLDSALVTDSVFCAGDNNGRIQAWASGGTAPYTFVLSPVDSVNSTGIFDNLGPGTYIVKLTDANSCDTVYSSPLILGAPSILQIDSILVDSIACAGATGTLNIFFLGGTPPYAISVTGGPDSIPNLSSPAAINLLAGDYDVVLYDAKGCSFAWPSTVSLIDPPAIEISSIVFTDSLQCFGDSTASIAVKATGGSGILDYILQPGNIPSSVVDSGYWDNLGAGNYSIEVSNSGGCFADSLISIYQPQPLSLVSALVTNNVFCSGDTVGEITAIGAGGTQPYTFRLLPVDSVNTTGVFQNLLPGTYTVRIIDGNLCDSIESTPLIIGSPTFLSIDTVIAEPIACNGDSAPITIVITGGTSPYDLLINSILQASGITDTAIVNLSAGLYTIEATDVNGCLDTYPIVINLVDPPAIQLDSIITTDVTTCYTSPEGAIAIYASGGSSTIEYSINGIDYQSENLFNNLLRGNYTVHYRDSVLRCDLTSNVFIDSPPQLLGNPIITNIVGDILGSIEFNASGGTPFSGPNPYLYSIDGNTPPFSTNPLFTNLDIGTYNLWVEDALGCVWSDIVFLGETELNVTIEVENPKCFGSPSGIINFKFFGTAPYSITRDGDVILTDWILDEFEYTGVAAADYLFRIEDADGKRFDTLITVTQPGAIFTNINTVKPTCQEYGLDGKLSTDGEISVRGQGGVGGYTYEWWNSATVDSNRTELLAGLYIVYTSDANSCLRIDTIPLNGETIIGAQMYIDPIPGLTFPGNIFPDVLELCYLTQWKLGVTHGGSSTPSYEWQPDSLLDDPDSKNSSSVDITVRNSATYSVITTVGVCMDFENVDIVMIDTLGMHITYEGEAITQEGNTLYVPVSKEMTLHATEGFLSYLWISYGGEIEDPTNQSILLKPETGQFITVTGLAGGTCYEYDTVLLFIKEPAGDGFTVFTPNGDGYNDIWIYSETSYQHEDIQMFIYNRWGQLVFQSDHYGSTLVDTWDGTSMQNGKDLPIGTYYYVVKFNNSQDEPKTGNITIVR